LGVALLAATPPLPDDFGASVMARIQAEAVRAQAFVDGLVELRNLARRAGDLWAQGSPDYPPGDPGPDTGG
jgi:hypothetical protein